MFTIGTYNITDDSCQGRGKPLSSRSLMGASSLVATAAAYATPTADGFSMTCYHGGCNV